ncbi:hypothetical protein Ciccas_002496 [Cichlidogyrus casuarinus]|uniref:G-protein coupled receptors family 1 profile domain-containing protein n=1 Tax=Cichlidogyrus casuarinus TaxID=1844966 RepID=A0ABD2QHB7_9PLAT
MPGLLAALLGLFVWTCSAAESSLVERSTNNTRGKMLDFKLVVFYDILYTIISLLGVIGNSVVLYIVVSKPHMRTITNIFIANLSVSDILMSIVATPFTALTTLHFKVLFESALFCAFMPVTMGVSVYVSTFSCMATAVDRYFVIVHPFVPRMRYWLCGIIIMIIWLMAIVVSIPLGIYQELKTGIPNSVVYCDDEWPTDESYSREMFTMMVFILQFLLPLVIISYCYISISKVLRLRFENKLGMKTKNRIREENDIERKRRTNTMLISMIVIFLVCWIPLNALWVVIDFKSNKDNFKDSSYFINLFVIFHQIAMSSAIYNPFLYAWMNENFKREFKSLLPCFFSKESRRYSMTIGQESTIALHNTEAPIHPTLFSIRDSVFDAKDHKSDQ